MLELEEFVDVSVVLRSGVYALMYRGEVIYIGQSKTMLMRIYAHRKSIGVNKKVREAKGLAFDKVWVLPCKLEQLDELERAMIAKYCPKYNVTHNHGAHVPPDLMAIIRTMNPDTLPSVPLEPRQPSWRRW